MRSSEKSSAFFFLRSDIKKKRSDFHRRLSPGDRSTVAVGEISFFPLSAPNALPDRRKNRPIGCTRRLHLCKERGECSGACAPGPRIDVDGLRMEIGGNAASFQG
ncbi:hypothetical protein EVAR_43872_1 [Eumeta japonica]|uniref:Uncharacterized protein n=1 Tax=Eumeta variegata TaxID=151549 RepID=A0A4C1WN17_EUMVA|nr:hypothetical protein EVAR_43872_1 [Eumeta japonica]